MRHKKKGNPLSRNSSHRKAMLSNLVNSFIDKGTIRTTHAKAKEGQRLAERMVTLGKKNTLHARRHAVALLHDKAVVKKLFDEIAPRYTDRNGGYTRVVKLGMRRGDGALVSQLEFVGDPVARGKAPAKKKAKAAATAADTAPVAAEEKKDTAEEKAAPKKKPAKKKAEKPAEEASGE